MTTSGTQSATFASTQATTDVTVAVIPTTITHAVQIARYFTEDLTQFVKETGLDLVRYLDIQDHPEYPQHIEEVIEMLYEDISHLIRDGLITAVNLLISEAQPNPNLGGAYVLRYHAVYLLNESGRTLKNQAPQRFGGFLSPPPKVWRDGNYRFDLLIDWNPKANMERRSNARRPMYCFDWVPPEARYDARSLIRYRSGGMTMDGAVIVDRREAADPHYQGI